MTERNGIIARLDSIDHRLERIERWIDEHNVLHGKYLQQTERRLTTLETQMQNRSMLGTIGLLISYVAAGLGALLGRSQ